jgi:hypothetical protein
MKTLGCVLFAALLAGCGAEVATTAATGAAIKKQELEAGKQVKEMADKKIDAAKQAMEQRAAQQENAGK